MTNTHDDEVARRSDREAFERRTVEQRGTRNPWATVLLWTWIVLLGVGAVMWTSSVLHMQGYGRTDVFVEDNIEVDQQVFYNLSTLFLKTGFAFLVAHVAVLALLWKPARS